MLWHGPTWQTAKRDGKGGYDFAPIFGTVAPIIRDADLSICHEEVPVAPKGTRYTSYPEFGVPTESAQAIADVGFDACSTASNHSFDRGFAGLKATLDAMDAKHVRHSGTARTEKEAQTPVILTASNGVKLGLVSGAYGLNGSTPPENQSWAWSDIEADHLIKRAEAAKKAGADIVIVAMHSGLEYHHEPTEQQVQLAEKLTASPAVDMVYCHHSHVVEPWARINGKIVMYGMGNLVAQQPPDMPRTYEGVIGRVTFSMNSGKVSTTKAEYIPILIGSKKDGPIRIHAVHNELTSGHGKETRLEEAEREVSKTVLSLGVQGVTEA
ncbi:CapA family protein [Cutibacterium equinum]|uniref:CapA family protein n=1 Tax=Cutibacterium equinum TaxID=3016342 RepID=A0ABY7R2K3_9ACTN|nr:CapA family protein [Cutibacterium equinum]WCC81087.1 CapA family protein [Cutibacterium equinum]